jgi:hypothetical protein
VNSKTFKSETVKKGTDFNSSSPEAFKTGFTVETRSIESVLFLEGLYE